MNVDWLRIRRTLKQRWRQFALMTAICLLNVLALMGGIVPSLATNPPDIVVILTDDMRADDWRILDDTQRLVGGTWFPNFVYNTPLCCPFRASFQRGQMVHNTGIQTNQDGSKFTALDAVRMLGSGSGHRDPAPPGQGSWALRT